MDEPDVTALIELERDRCPLSLADCRASVDAMAEELHQLGLEDAVEPARLVAYLKKVCDVSQAVQRLASTAKWNGAERMAGSWLLVELASLMVEANQLIITANEAHVAAFRNRHLSIVRG